MKKIVLNLMLKNEEKTVIRCLESIQEIVDAIHISDTGSTDDTLQLIAKFQQKTKIPLNIATNEFKNYGFNRTESIKQAQEFIKNLQWNPTQTYILLVDADMIYEHIAPLDKQNLTHDMYNVEQISQSERYWNPRLLRSSLEWRVVGSTHEYYDCATPFTQSRLTSLRINDVNDGANKADKFDRDERLLLSDLADLSNVNINNAQKSRTMFYLAQTYQHRCKKDKHDLENAIKYYQQHLNAGSWEEEMWYSVYSIGMCYQAKGEWGNAIEWYLKAYQRRPWRFEPLVKIASYYRESGFNDVAMMFLNNCSHVYPNNDVLFIDRAIYEYEIDWNISICAFYAGKKELGHAATERLLKGQNIPQHIRQQSFANLFYYVKKCGGIISEKQINIDVPNGFNVCNPTICQNGLILRLVNYTQHKARNYIIKDDDGIIKTENMWLPFATDSTLFSRGNLIKNATKGPFFESCRVRGLEDMRIFQWKGKTWASCTCLEYEENHCPKICLVEFDDQMSQVIGVTKLSGFGDNLVQKNWLPFIINDNLHFIYNYDPLVILTFDGKNISPILTVKNTKINTSTYRGSAGPVIVGNDILILIHEVYDGSDGRRYMHRFIKFDKDFNLIGVTPLIYFINNDGVEMVTGMMLKGDKIILTVGVEDCKAFMVTVDLNHILYFLENV